MANPGSHDCFSVALLKVAASLSKTSWSSALHVCWSSLIYYSFVHMLCEGIVYYSGMILYTQKKQIRFVRPQALNPGCLNHFKTEHSVQELNMKTNTQTHTVIMVIDELKCHNSIIQYFQT